MASNATVGAVMLCGVAGALVLSGAVGSSGELPERFMQGVVSEIGGSGKVFYSDSSVIRNLEI